MRPRAVKCQDTFDESDKEMNTLHKLYVVFFHTNVDGVAFKS